MANVEPLQRHVSAHIVGGGRAVGQLAGGLASSANVPVGESLRTAVDLAFDATRQLQNISAPVICILEAYIRK